MNKFKSLLLCLSISIAASAQNSTTDTTKKIVVENKESKEDMSYELKHKSSDWYKKMMQPNANYFEIKNKYDHYFAGHLWEKSKPRQLGEAWLKTKIFYLDENGNIQDEPETEVKPDGKKKKTRAGATTRTLGSWHMLGPVNSTDLPTSARGDRGGYVLMNRIDPTNTQKFFSSFVTGGLWVTTDGGTSWAITDANISDEPYYDLDVCITNPSVVYAISNSRVIKSTDSGFSWTATALNKSNFTGSGFDIAASPNNPNIAVARWANKIYRTTDGGTTWTMVLNNLFLEDAFRDHSVTGEVLDWSIANENEVYCVNTDNNNQVQVYRSTDTGATFALLTNITIDPTANGQIVGWAKLLLPYTNATDIYVALGTGTSSNGHQAVQLYKLNGSTGTEIIKRVNMLDGTFPYAIHHGDIDMDKFDENKLVFGSYGNTRSYYSTDNGITFTPAANTQHYDLRSVCYVNGNVLIGNDGESVLSTDSGVSFLNVTNSISNHELWGFGAAHKTAILASGNNHGPCMVREDANGFEWYNLSGADQGNTDVNPLDDRYVYSQGYSNYRYFRTGVHTFVNESNMLDEGGIYSYFNNFEFHPNLYYSIVSHHAGDYPVGNPNLAVWKNSLMRSDDNGNSISLVHTFPNRLFREKFCMTNPDVMYVVVGIFNNQVWKTIDGGVTWSNVTPTIMESNNKTNISDIAVHDTDPNQVWITYSGVQTDCKVLKSSTGGSSWTNLTQPILTTFPNTKIIFQRGSDGGVYVGNKSGVYYRNNTMPNWVLLGNGLPQLDVRNMFINYNLGKLRIGTSRGAWENDLYETSSPKAQISANTNKIVCVNSETIQFKDYSTVRNASATWAWSFPGGTPATSTLENPIVSYAGSGNGAYDVSLTVTDAFGTSSQTLTGFIQVDASNCTIDTIPGSSLTLSNPTDFAQQNEPLNINVNRMTISGWIKPNGTQADFAGIIFSGSDGACGLNYNGTNLLGYHWQGTSGSYNFNSGLVIPENEWSHVALVISPTQARLYLNGNVATNTISHGAVNLDQMFQFGIDRGNTARTFKGEMDEICIYNRALSTSEIRELMNLTRNNPNANSLPQLDTALVSYYQFNEGPGLPAYDKVRGKHASLIGGATKSTVSTAPVGGGTFQRLSVTTGGLKNFATPGVELTFPASGVYPNGDIVVSRINVGPDQLPLNYILPSSPLSYYVIRNYGSNATFNALSSIKFKNVQGTTSAMVASPATLTLYKRPSNADSITWNAPIDNADTVTDAAGIGTVAFSTGLVNTSFSQFSIGSVALPLPIQFISFNAKKINNNQGLLSWDTDNKEQVKEYILEHSDNGIDFSILTTVPVTQSINYSYLHETPSTGNNFYRLKIVEMDGTLNISEVRKLNFTTLDATLLLSPNPTANGAITFAFNGLPKKAGMSLSITNAAGQLVKSMYVDDLINNKYTMTDIGSKAAGVYYVRITLTTGQIFTEKVVLNR